MEQKAKAGLFANRTVQESILFFLLSIALLAYALYKHYTGLPVSWEMSPYLFPVLIAVFLFLLSISLFTDGRRQAAVQQKEAGESTPAAIDWKSTLFTVVASIVYFLLMPVIKFIPATILFLVAMFWYLKERRWWLVALLSAATAVLIYVMFGVLLNVMLP